MRSSPTKGMEPASKFLSLSLPQPPWAQAFFKIKQNKLQYVTFISFSVLVYKQDQYINLRWEKLVKSDLFAGKPLKNIHLNSKSKYWSVFLLIVKKLSTKAAKIKWQMKSVRWSRRPHAKPWYSEVFPHDNAADFYFFTKRKHTVLSVTNIRVRV